MFSGPTVESPLLARLCARASTPVELASSQPLALIVFTVNLTAAQAQLLASHSVDSSFQMPRGFRLTAQPAEDSMNFKQ